MDQVQKFELKKWNAVTLWKWDFQVETCAICKIHLMEPCIDCTANYGSQVAKECDIAWGICNHGYHFHCISRWIKNRPVCPLDNRDWEWGKYGKSYMNETGNFDVK